MKKIKTFFSITDNKYCFNIYDITSIFTVLNVSLIIAGFKYAPIFGLVNCIICIINQIKNHSYINSYVTQIMLVILNIYFLM